MGEKVDAKAIGALFVWECGGSDELGVDLSCGCESSRGGGEWG